MSFLGSLRAAGSALGILEPGQGSGTLAVIQGLGSIANVVIGVVGGGKPQTQGLISAVTGATTFVPTPGVVSGPGVQFAPPPPTLGGVGPALGDIRFFPTGLGPPPAPAEIGRGFITPGDVPMSLLGSGFTAEQIGQAGIPGAITATARVLESIFGRRGGGGGGDAGGVGGQLVPSGLGGGMAGMMEATGLCPTGALFEPGRVTARPVREITDRNPETGRLETWLHAGRPVLYTGDLRASKRVKKLAARAGRVSRKR